ncbi:hypothetical protein HMI55_002915 [Coelomomyces lativittatus]|nr:hypothetical protein HMI55_002915 [Coelomomyces lativittatus]
MDLHTSPKDLQNGGPVPGASKLLSFYSTPIKHETEPFSVQKKESTPSRQIHSPSIYSSSYVSSVPATFNSLVNGWMDESLLVHKKKLHHELLEPVPPTPLDDVIENLQSQLRFHPFFSSTSTTQMTSSLPTQQGEDKNPSNFHINPSPYCIKDFPSMVPLKDETVTPLLSNSWVPLNPTSEPLRSSSPKNETQVSSTDLPSSFSKSYDTHVHLSRRTTSMTPPPLPPLLKDAPTKVGLVTPFPSPSPCQVPKEKEKHNIDPNLLHVLLSALPQASIQQELLTPWMNVTELKLSGCDLRSCEGLASVTPCLQVCDLSYNQLRTLTGLPLTLMDLNVSQNPLVSSTSFSPFVHLESLNVSHTGWTHGEGFFGLLHLRELYLDHNAIVHLNSVDHPPWPKLPSLTYLSLSHNALVEFTLDPTQVPKLKVLNVSHNELSQVGHEPPGLSLFLQLTSLNLASNAFLQFPYSHPGLQVLDVSDNLIQEFDVSGFPNLKQLYLQRNQLHTLHGGGRMGKVQLDVLDVSDQSSLFFPSTTLTSFSSTTTTTTVTDTPTRTPTPTMTSLFSISTLPEMFPRELYLKGHVSLPFHSSFVFYSVVHLDLARCQLNQLPTFFSSLFPSLLHLNVSQNPLTALPDLTSLRYLTQLNCSSTHLTSLVTFFSQCPCTQLTHLHLEFTPLTQGFMEDKVNLEATPYDPTLVFFGPDLSRPWTPSLLRKDDRPNLELPPTKENLELLWYRCQVLAQCPHLTFLDDFPVDRSLYLKYHALLRPIMHPNEHEAT